MGVSQVTAHYEGVDDKKYFFSRIIVNVVKDKALNYEKCKQTISSKNTKLSTEPQESLFKRFFFEFVAVKKLSAL